MPVFGYIIASGFVLSLESNSHLVWFGFLVIGLKYQKLNHEQIVFASRYDWFTGLSASFLTARSNYFAFGFRTALLLEGLLSAFSKRKAGTTTEIA